MKKFAILLLISMLVLALPQSALADVPAPGGPFTTWFRVQNIHATDTAQCFYTIYNSSGTAMLTSSTINVSAGDSLYVYVPSLSLASGQYSAVVSCDKPAAAAVNYGDPDSEASHSGISSPNNVWYAPGIYDNYYTFYSNIVVQNAHGGSVNATLEIYRGGVTSPVYTNTKSIPMNGYVTWDQAGMAELLDNVSYSAKITATGSIAPIVNIYGTGGNAANLYSYNPFPAGTTKAYAPIIMNQYFTWRTALVIQNVSSSSNNIRVEYNNGFVQTATLSAYSAITYFTPDYSSNLPPGDNVSPDPMYSAVIESTNSQPLVVMVNQSNPNKRAGTYTGFPGGAPKVYTPILIQSHTTHNYVTSITCQNLGTSNTVIRGEFAGFPGVYYDSSSVGPLGSFVFYLPNFSGSGQVPPPWMGSGWFSSTASPAQNIACVVNYNTSGTSVDKFMTYNAQIP